MRRNYLGFLLILFPVVLWLASRQILAVAQENPRPAAAVHACHLPQVCRSYSTRTPTPTRTATRTGTLANSPTPSDAPDLVIPDWFWRIDYQGCPWGSPGKIYVRVENQGPVEAGFFIVTINDATATVLSLPAHASTEASVPYARGPVGHIFAYADSTDLIHEMNERNNLGRILFTPPPPCSTNTPVP